MTLSLAHSSITSYPSFTGLAGLITLDLSYLSITSPPSLTGLSLLQTIDLTGTAITTPPTFSGVTTNIRTIKLTGSSITSAPVITGLVLLNIIYLNNCPGLNTAAIVDNFFIAMGAMIPSDNHNGTCDTSGTTHAVTSASDLVRTQLAAAPRSWTILKTGP